MTASCFCNTVRKADRAIFRVYDEAMATCDITVMQFSILRTLLRDGDLPLSELADALVMDRTSLYRTIKPLQQSGAVLIRDAESGRSKIAVLTVLGKKQIKQAEPYWQAAQDRLTDLFGKQKWQSLSKELLNLSRLIAAQR